MVRAPSLHSTALIICKVTAGTARWMYTNQTRQNLIPQPMQVMTARALQVSSCLPISCGPGSFTEKAMLVRVSARCWAYFWLWRLADALCWLAGLSAGLGRLRPPASEPVPAAHHPQALMWWSKVAPRGLGSPQPLT